MTNSSIVKNINAMNEFSKNLNQYDLLSESELDRHISFPEYLDKIINCLEYSLDGLNRSLAFTKRMNKIVNEYCYTSARISEKDKKGYEFTKQYYTVQNAISRVSTLFIEQLIRYANESGVISLL